MPKDEGVVARDVHDIDGKGGKHGLQCLASGTERGTERERQRLHERQAAGYAEIQHSVCHQPLAQPEGAQQRLSPQPQRDTHSHAEQRVDEDGNADYLHETRAETGAEILRAQYGGSHRHELIDEKHERHKLVVKPDSRDGIVAETRQHHCIYRAEKHDERDVDENRQRQPVERFFQRDVILHKENPKNMLHIF